MKYIFLLSLSLLLGFSPLLHAQKPVTYLSLEGRQLTKGNAINAAGNTVNTKVALLRIIRTTSKKAKGTILLLPGGGYKFLKTKSEGLAEAALINKQGFDAVILDYHVDTAKDTRDLALKDVIQAFKTLRAEQAKKGLADGRLVIKGFEAGAHLAARALQFRNENEQPDSVHLVNPAYFNETLVGTVFPQVMPPLYPKAKLHITFSPNGNESWKISAKEYQKTWNGYLPLKGLNPAATAVEGYSTARHNEKLEASAKTQHDLILLGNSITNNFEKPEYQLIWNQFFAPRKALNLGFSGYRTENLIWNLEHGALDGQSPKVLVLEIGTNNVDEKNYPTRHTAAELAGGIEAIVKLVRQKLPLTKIILLRCFPGAYGGPSPTSHRAILERASDIVSKLADGKNVFYCDVNHLFLNFDGAINKYLMPDYLHPSPEGARRWAQGMEPLLSSLMGDKSLDTALPANTAVIPVSKLENDSYNWWDRHAEVLRIKDTIDPEIVMIGNSITHFWGGVPKLVNANGEARVPNGPKSWESVFTKYRVLNLGFGWDRTQNVLWRLDHGELDGLSPRAVIVNIGTNNTSETANARMNTAEEIAEGIRAICLRIRSKVPTAQIVLMAIFPREKDPQHPRRVLINEINKQLEAFAKENKLKYLDIGPKLLAADGTLLPGMMPDNTHPSDQGYQIWANALRPYLDSLIIR
ncbi:MAG: hypothetical protein EOO88_07720 [Pedobacter sp.]|nr:MAG: hypothetical protein EOO88_07720 [Pedobacter sp.]